jgi:hypothetical protein
LVAVVDRACELRIADDVTASRANEEVRLADDLALVAVEIDDGGIDSHFTGIEFRAEDRFPAEPTGFHSTSKLETLR